MRDPTALQEIVAFVVKAWAIPDATQRIIQICEQAVGYPV